MSQLVNQGIQAARLPPVPLQAAWAGGPRPIWALVPHSQDSQDSDWWRESPYASGQSGTRNYEELSSDMTG